MRAQAELHAAEITKYNDQMSKTNNETMSKLHLIVAKHDQDQAAQTSFATQNATNANHRATLE